MSDNTKGKDARLKQLADEFDKLGIQGVGKQTLICDIVDAANSAEAVEQVFLKVLGGIPSGREMHLGKVGVVVSRLSAAADDDTDEYPAVGRGETPS